MIWIFLQHRTIKVDLNRKQNISTEKESIQSFSDFYLYSICLRLNCVKFPQQIWNVCDSWWATCHTTQKGHQFPATLDCPDFLQFEIFRKKQNCDASFSKETKLWCIIDLYNFSISFPQTCLVGYYLNDCNIEPFAILRHACKLIGMMEQTQTDPSTA